jgi:hypothetical protein
MRHGVGADRDAFLSVEAEGVPVHGRQLRGVVALELCDCQRRAVARVTRAHEQLSRHAQLPQRGEDAGSAPIRVVEGCTHFPNSVERPHLTKKQLGRNRKPVLPGGRDGVVAEDERPTDARRPLAARDAPPVLRGDAATSAVPTAGLQASRPSDCGTRPRDREIGTATSASPTPAQPNRPAPRRPTDRQLGGLDLEDLELQRAARG